MPVVLDCVYFTSVGSDVTRPLRVRFGPCVFDTATRQLHRDGQPVPLSPKAFLLLEALVEARPRALSRAELHDRIWPATFISASSLNRLVAELRAAIGDDAHEPRFLRTVHGYGYAFSGEAGDEPVTKRGERREPPAPAAPYLLLGTEEYELSPGENLVGRAEECLVCVSSPRVSRRHARIRLADGRAIVEDLDSKNGTYVSGRLLAGPHELRDGDEILVGPVALRYRAFRRDGSTLSNSR